MDLDQAEGDFPKYFRPGYISAGDEKASHTLADYAFSFFPNAERMPKHWHYRSAEYFNKKHGHLGREIWSLTKSYHLLILSGQRVIRIWHDTCVARVDLSPGLAGYMAHRGYDTQYVSRLPFEHRMLAEEQKDIKILMGGLREVYGI